MKEKEFNIFVDSTYDWTKTIDGTGTGEICIVIPKKSIFKKFKLTLSFPGLRQLNNRFELVAIQKGLEFAKKLKLKKFRIFSDSKVAIGWANHPNASWIPREKNVAGFVFEK